ncbi:uncharacterized protein AB675_6148 [Cyphellophora attinorum]|uniref:Uncharacterized protein n=1 Tax=Cyphellophora attinorum TaxID=1664694 RepID=A0A0N1P2F6_9EURO|nr:uncharacterized protein AB675_6148 [Phialophora attinorum]KPI43794.1 hypothetical protein AB675_6148 [Phialophora attinorum]
MTSARLSPAANLLRNSKLFALPAAVPLPPAKPTSQQISTSDTATTIYPTHAAVYTTSQSLKNGDWGLKRALPGKAFSKTRTPVIRIRNSIDTAEHIADFESAADHVQTLNKWQDTGVMIGNSPMPYKGTYHSAFASNVDNTTVDSSALSDPRIGASNGTATTHIAWSNAHRGVYNSAYRSNTQETDAAPPNQNTCLPSIEETLEQFEEDQKNEAIAKGHDPPITPQSSPQVRPPSKRWRYNGPWLAGLSNLDFEQFMEKVDDKTIAAFRRHLTKGIRAQRQKDYAVVRDRAKANQEELPPEPSSDVSESEIDARLQFLRHKPNDFGPEIATFFDLPTGPRENRNDGRSEYLYPPNSTGASENYQNFGLPRTHPSAGFSYLRSARYARMSPQRGPMNPNAPMPARVLKDVHSRDTSEKQSLGVGGFVVRLGNVGGSGKVRLAFQATAGGRRLATKFKDASVLADGSLEIGVDSIGDLDVRLDGDNMPYFRDDFEKATQVESAPNRLPEMDSYGVPTYKKAQRLRNDDPDVLQELFSGMRGNGVS